MFTRSRRIPRSAFPAALASGRRLSSAHFAAVVPSKGTGYAVVVPKKVAKLSVTRHRIKRRVLSALQSLRPPPSLVLFPKATVTTLSAAELRAELEALLSKVGKAA